MYGSDDTDFELVVGPAKKTIREHSFVLKAHSPYFRAMLKGGLRESGANSLELSSVSSQALEKLMPFLYGGRQLRSDLSPEDCRSMQVTADFLQVHDFKEYIDATYGWNNVRKGSA